MIQQGMERGLIESEATWFGYRELRSITSHVYDPAKAGQVFAVLPQFLDDARRLLARLIAAKV